MNQPSVLNHIFSLWSLAAGNPPVSLQVFLPGSFHNNCLTKLSFSAVFVLTVDSVLMSGVIAPLLPRRVAADPCLDLRCRVSGGVPSEVNCEWFRRRTRHLPPPTPSKLSSVSDVWGGSARAEGGGDASHRTCQLNSIEFSLICHLNSHYFTFLMK